MKLKDAYSLEEKLWPTWIVYSKAKTWLCWLRSIWSRRWFFQWSCMDVRFGLWRRLSTKELMLLNCGVGEDSWGSLGLQGDPTSPFWRSTLGFFGSNDAKAETPVLWPPHVKSWLIGEDSDAGGEGDDRGWDGGMASLTRCTWVWVNSRSWWWTGRPGVLRFMGLQRIGHDWETELNWIYFFFLGMVLIPASCTMSQTSVHSSSGTLSDLIPWIYLSLPLYNHKHLI